MKWLFACVSALLLTGCGSVVGPFAARKPMRVDDPHLSIYEQKQRGRDRLALPEQSKQIVPTPQSYGDFALPDSPFRNYTFD